MSGFWSARGFTQIVLSIFMAFMISERVDAKAESVVTVFVAPTQGASMPDEDRQAIDELLKMGVLSQKGHTTAESKKGATLVLEAQVLRLGTALILNLQKKNSQGQILFSEKMKAASMSDMDTVTSRLTMAVLKEERIANTADVTNITQEEEIQGTRRIQATRQWIIGLGPGWASNLNSKGGGFTFLIGYLWGLDPDFGINLSWNFNGGPSGDESDYNDLSIGGEYYFSRTKNTPYVGLRFGHGGAEVNSDSCAVFADGTCDKARGWALNGSVGYKMFRTSTVNAALQLNYSQIFDKTRYGQPSLTTVQFLVYY